MEKETKTITTQGESSIEYKRVLLTFATSIVAGESGTDYCDELTSRFVMEQARTLTDAYFDEEIKINKMFKELED